MNKNAYNGSPVSEETDPKKKSRLNHISLNIVIRCVLGVVVALLIVLFYRASKLEKRTAEVKAATANYSYYYNQEPVDQSPSKPTQTPAPTPVPTFNQYPEDVIDLNGIKIGDESAPQLYDTLNRYVNVDDDKYINYQNNYYVTSDGSVQGDFSTGNYEDFSDNWVVLNSVGDDQIAFEVGATSKGVPEGKAHYVEYGLLINGEQKDSYILTSGQTPDAITRTISVYPSDVVYIILINTDTEGKSIYVYPVSMDVINNAKPFSQY